MKTSIDFHRISVILISALCGALAGAAAGFSVATPEWTGNNYFFPRVTTTPAANSTTTRSGFSFVPLERRALTPLLPPEFIKRRASSVATLYRKPVGTTLEERILDPEKVLGQAVALTSDGWLITTASTLGTLRVSDIVIWHEGRTTAIDRAVLDRINDTVYLKTKLNGLTPASFAQTRDLSPGAEIWSETRPDQFAPLTVLSLHERIHPNEATSSETAARRITLTGVAVAGDRGSAVWDPNGSFVGLIDSGPGERLRMVPATSIASSFEELLVNGDIHHAQLGIYAADLATLQLDGTRVLPNAGAWIHEEKKSGKPAILKDSAAAKAKLQNGDVILHVERDILDGTADLGEILSEYRPGSQIVLRILRGTSNLDVPVTLGSVTTSEVLK
jgi:serine protease Do